MYQDRKGSDDDISIYIRRKREDSRDIYMTSRKRKKTYMSWQLERPITVEVITAY
jgi:hypothetical protein